MLGCSRCLQSPLPVLFRSEAFGGGRQFTPRLWVSPSSAVGSLRRAELWSQAWVLLRSPRRQGGHHHPARPVPAAGRAALLPCGRGENLLRDPAQSHDPQPRGECLCVPMSPCPEPCWAARTAPLPVPAPPARSWRGSDSPGCWLDLEMAGSDRGAPQGEPGLAGLAAVEEGGCPAGDGAFPWGWVGQGPFWGTEHKGSAVELPSLTPCPCSS